MPMDVNDYLAGNFLTKDDCGDGTTGTILDLELVEVKNAGRTVQKMSVIWREKDLKPWLPSKGCARELRDELGSDSTEWTGAVVELFNDGTVEMGGERVGGIRIRKITPKAGTQRELGTEVAAESEIPFDAGKVLDRLHADRVSA